MMFDLYYNVASIYNASTLLAYYMAVSLSYFRFKMLWVVYYKYVPSMLY